MFKVNEDKSIYATRGDVVNLSIMLYADGVPRTFKSGDVVRFKVVEKKRCNNVVLQNDFPAEEGATKVSVVLNSEDMKFGDVIGKPKDYWYEVELNPETQPNTVIGYDEDGPKVFRVFPEGGNME